MVLFANAGLPMLMLGLPAMLLMLLPIVCIEAYWYRRFLSVEWKQAWSGSWKANIWSTCLGIPLTWIVLVAIEFTLLATGSIYGQSPILAESYFVSYLYFIVTSPWVIPLRYGFEHIVYGSMMVLLLPCYLVSYLGEARILRRLWPEIDRKLLRRQVWYVHCVTYGLLFLLAWWRFSTLAN